MTARLVLIAALMQAATPPLIMLFALVFLREKTALAQTLGVALSLLGVDRHFLMGEAGHA